MLRRVSLVALLVVAEALQAAPPQGTSRGVTADGRVITSSYGVAPPWGRDITRLVKPQYPESLRAKRPVVSGFFRLVFDLGTGRVRQVVVEQSSGYPAGDASIIAALQQWQLRPNTWREFQVHLSIGLDRKPEASNQSKPTASFQQRGDPLSSALDTKGVRHRGSDYIGQAPWIDDAIKIVPLKYPYEARVRHIQGSGLFRLSLDLNTGSVSKVTLIQSTGSPMLDNYTSDTLHRWRWKPARWQEIDMPIKFTMSPRYKPKAETYIGSRPVSR